MKRRGRSYGDGRGLLRRAALIKARRRASYAEGLRCLVPFFLLLEALVLGALAFYRLRLHALIASGLPEALEGQVAAGYREAALSSDSFAACLLLALLTALWLLAGRARRASAALSLLAVAAWSLLMVLATDFFRVYQTAFTKAFVGGEQVTGVSSILRSAWTELSGTAKLGVAASLLLLALAPLLLRLRWRGSGCGLLRLAPPLVLAAALVAALASAPGPGPDGSDQALARGRELGLNPVAALAYGPARRTFVPELPDTAVPSAYATDSLESPEAMRRVPAARRGRHNVVLYLFESTSWAYLGLEAGGKPVLPAMRDLAARGLLLENHYSNYPLSANTMWSVLASRYSMYGKSMILHEYHDADVNSLTEVLSAEGYATCLIHTGDLLYASRDKFLKDRGIDRIILEKELSASGRYPGKVGWGADERLMIEPGVAWAKAQEGPWFLALLPVNPHHPYAVPDDFERLVDAGEPGITDSERIWRNYLNSLHYADAAMGELVARLGAEGLMEDTVFVMVTDHGEAFWQHRGNYNHPLLVYEENIHVPALFYGPSVLPPDPGLASVTRHIDVLPSILDLLGIEDGTPRDGESIFSASREKLAVAHTSWTDEYMAVRDGRWKYIERMKDGREELYDLPSDPLEKANLAAQRPEIAARYRSVADGAVAYMLKEAAETLPRSGTGQAPP